MGTRVTSNLTEKRLAVAELCATNVFVLFFYPRSTNLAFLFFSFVLSTSTKRTNQPPILCVLCRTYVLETIVLVRLLASESSSDFVPFSNDFSVGYIFVITLVM